MKLHKNIKIFIVDDDPLWTEILAQTLTNLGYTNLTAFSNGNDCINNLKYSPSLVFLDYKMEGMDGLEVLQKIKFYDSEIVVVFCTDYMELSVAVKAMKNGSFDYLLKSNATNIELSLIIKYLEQKLAFAEKVF